MHSRTKKIIYVWLSLNYIKRTLDPNLLFTDTGSLTYEFKSEDVSENFYIDNDLCDLSNNKKYPKFLILSMKKYCQNERWVQWKNNYLLCWIKVKNLLSRKYR